MRTAFVFLLVAVACHKPEVMVATSDAADPPTVTITPIPTVTAAATIPPAVTASATSSPGEAAARVQSAIPRWLSLLARGDDATFLQEAIVPEELEKVLSGKSKDDFVKVFREDKHDTVVKLFKAIRGTEPKSIRQDGARTLVVYDPPSVKTVTFIVDGAHVYIKN